MIIWDERFEGSGYEETWSDGETVGSGCTLDEDASTSKVGSPLGWGYHCLKCITGGNDVFVEHSLSSVVTSHFGRLEFVVTSESLADSDANYTLHFWDGSWNDVLQFYLTQSGGQLMIELALYNNGSWHYYNANISLGTCYRLDWKYKTSDRTWAWKLNGVVQNSGSLTGSYRSGIQHFRLGQFWNSAATTIYFDLFTLSDSTWVALELPVAPVTSRAASVDPTVIMSSVTITMAPVTSRAASVDPTVTTSMQTAGTSMQTAAKPITYRQSKTLSTNVYTPLWLGKQFIESIEDRYNSIRFNIQAVGGYWDAAFSIRSRMEHMEEWLTEGLGRHIEIRDDALDIIWEGYVNQVTATTGELSVQVGPLDEVVNRVCVSYSFTDPNQKNARGMQKFTTWADDEESQKRYGIRERVLSMGGANDEQAVQYRDRYLADNAWPDIKHDIDSVRHENNIVVDCYGYARMLDDYTYTQEDISGEIDLTDKLKLVLLADPNGLFVTESVVSLEKIQNGSFERAGAGGSDVFASWTEHAGTGTIVDDTGFVKEGGHACRLTAGSSADTYISQDITVVPGGSYNLSWFVAKSSSAPWSGYLPRYSIYDVTNGAYIRPLTRIWGTEQYYKRYYRTFTAPTGCTTVRILFQCPTGNSEVGYIDGVSVKEFNTPLVNLTKNTTKVPAFEKRYSTAWSVIKELISLGDEDSNRYLFGIYAGRMPRYHPAPTEVYYRANVGDNEQRYELLSGQVVKPYNILPGRWLLFSDILVGESLKKDLRRDLRAMFLEEVRYSAGMGLTINQGRTGQAEQKLSKLGLISSYY